MNEDRNAIVGVLWAFVLLAMIFGALVLFAFVAGVVGGWAIGAFEAGWEVSRG